MTTTQLDTSPGPAARPLDTSPAPAARLLPRLVSDTRYVLTGLPTAVASITVCLTGAATGLGLAVVWVGVPLTVAALLAARRFADAERARIAPVLGRPATRPDYRTVESTSRAWRLLGALADPQSWRDLAHATLRIIPGTVSFALVATWWAGVLGGLSWSLWGWALPDGPDDSKLPELLGLGDAYLTNVLFYLVLALFFAATLPAVARCAALLDARFADRLLNRP